MRDLSFAAGKVLGSGEAAMAASRRSGSIVETLCPASTH